MIIFHNFEEERRIKKAVCTSHANAVKKIKEYTKSISLDPIFAYMTSNKPPLHYCFSKKDKFIPCFAYIQHEDINLSKGNETCQITSKNLNLVINTIEAHSSNHSEQVKIFLKDDNGCQEDIASSREDALIEVLDFFKDEILSKKFYLQYFYHAYHLPPSVFHLFKANGDPTGVFALLKNEKNKEFKTFNREGTSLSPILVKYSLNGGLL